MMAHSDQDTPVHGPANKRRRLALSLNKHKEKSESKSEPKDLTPGPQYAELKEEKLVVKETSVDSNIEGTTSSSPSQIQPSEQTRESQTSSEGYYLFNFKYILNLVLSSSPERHVIAHDTNTLVERFMALSQREQQLYVRLFLRKHQWLRSTKIIYKDITVDLRPVMQGLIQHEFLLDESRLTDPSEVLSLLQVSELKELRKELNLPSSVGGNQKSQIIEGLFKHDRQHQPLFGRSQFMVSVVKRAKKKLGACVKVDPHSVEVFSKVMLLFSLTSEHGGEDDNEFSQIIFRLLQVNVGTLKYPEYELNVSRSLFPTEESFQKYYEVTKEGQALSQAIESKDDSFINLSLEKIRAGFDSELQTFQTASSKDLSHKTQTRTKSSDSTSVPSTNHSKVPSLPSFLLPYTTCWQYASLLSRIAEYMEKKCRYELANEILEHLLSQRIVCIGSRGRWWERLALNYDFHLKNKVKCLEVIKAALDDPIVRLPRRLSLTKRARKLCEAQALAPNKSGKKGNLKSKSRQVKSAGNSPKFELSDFPEVELIAAPEVTISAAILRSDLRPVYLTTTNSSTSTVQPCTAMVGVEGYAMYHYNHTEGWPCVVHAEGSSFSAMFGLLMWDVMFAGGIPDVFRTPYQGGPLDLYSDCFYQNRRELIEKRLAWIKNATSEDIGLEVERCWNENCGTVCAAINWDLFNSADDAKSLAVCMGGELLSNICDVFSKGFGHSRGGLPDLTLWNPTSSTCKFVEVKGPGDRLSHKQVVWLSRLAQWGCTVEVCHVKGSSSKTLD